MKRKNMLRWAVSVIVIVGVLLSIELGAKMPVIAQENITLSVWINDFFPETHKWIRETLIPEFERTHPNTKIDFLYIGWAHAAEKYLTAWASGMTPDLFEPAIEQVEEMVAKKQVLPLNKYVEGWEDFDDFLPGAFDSYATNGTYWTMPFRVDLRAIYYRKDIFEEVGLDPEKAPDTWEDLREAVTKTTIREGKKLIRAGYSLTSSPGFLAQQWVEFLWQNGGEALNEEKTKATFNSPEGVEALEFVVDIYNIVAPAGVGYLPEDYPIPLFALGKIAIEYLNGPGGFRKLKKYAPEHLKDFGLCLPLKKKIRATNYFPGGFSIVSTCKYPDEAWEFMKFFGSSENQARLSIDTNGAPARKSSYADEYYQDPIWDRMWSAAKYAKSYVLIPEWWMLMSKLGDNLQAAVKKTMTPEEALNDAVSQWDKVLYTR